MPSTIPRPARRIGTSVSFLPLRWCRAVPKDGHLVLHERMRDDPQRWKFLTGVHARESTTFLAVSDSAHAEERAPASRRILDAARALVARGGAAQVSMGDVAAVAGVSKALVHYHFRDKDSLLHALVEDVGSRVVIRARDAMAPDDASHALDAYWSWLQQELRAGDLRILL